MIMAVVVGVRVVAVIARLVMHVRVAADIVRVLRGRHVCGVLVSACAAIVTHTS